MLKNLLQISQLHSTVYRTCFASYHHLNLTHTNDSYSIIEMNKKPVNSLSLESMQELINAVDEIEKCENSRGVIITSSLKAFCAGLDLNELIEPDIHRLKAFWTSFQELHIRLYTSPLVTIAAINGAAITGGCALCLTCDYRMMSEGDSKIGLNTVHTGLFAPYWVDKLYAFAIGHRKAERLVSLGKLCTTEEAFSIGIVDEVVPTADLMNAAMKEIKSWLAIPDMGRIITKQLMRNDFVKEFHTYRETDTEQFKDIVCRKASQNHILKYTDKLRRR